MSHAVRWVRVVYLGLLVSSLLLFFAGCAFLFNQAPEAVITASALSGTSPLTVNFSAMDSSDPDPDGEVVSVEWNFGDGTTSTEWLPHHTFVALTTATTFTVTLRVVDDQGASDETEQMIEVLPQTSNGGGPGQPVARIVVDRFIGPTPVTVNFDGTDSTPGAGTITQYRWDFGDGATATGAHAQHTYKPEATKEFTATLFVWNSNGNLDTEQVTIIVVVPDAATDGEDPVAEFTMTDPLVLYDSPNPAQVPTLYEVTFDPRGSYADAGHSIEYFAWDFGDGKTFVETSNLDVTHVYELDVPARTYVVRLYVYDDQGLEDLRTVNLTLTQPVDE